MYQPPAPPRHTPPTSPPATPPKRRRRTILWAGLATTTMLATAGGIAAAAGSSHLATRPAAGSSFTPIAPALSGPPTTPAIPNPAGTITGSCDVSLSDSISGQNYLTAQVTAANTGNIGTHVRIRVTWPLQGFPPIHQAKTVRLGTGGTHAAQFRVPVTLTQVSQFQDVQLAATGDPCHYTGTIEGTFGHARP